MKNLAIRNYQISNQQQNRNMCFGKITVKLNRSQLGKYDDGLLATAEAAKQNLIQNFGYFNARFYVTRDKSTNNFLIFAREFKKGLKGIFTPKIKDTAINNVDDVIKKADILSSRLYYLVD